MRGVADVGVSSDPRLGTTIAARICGGGVAATPASDAAPSHGAAQEAASFRGFCRAGTPASQCRGKTSAHATRARFSYWRCLGCEEHSFHAEISALPYLMRSPPVPGVSTDKLLPGRPASARRMGSCRWLTSSSHPGQNGWASLYKQVLPRVAREPPPRGMGTTPVTAVAHAHGGKLPI